MTKVLPIAIGVLALIGMASFSVYQTSTIKEQNNTIRVQTEEMKFLEESLQTEMGENELLLSDNTLLRQKIEELQDSIAQLQLVIGTLEGKVKKQTKTICKLRSKIKQLENEYDGLKARIAQEARQENADRELIAQLEAEKAEMRREMANLNQEKNEAAKERKASKKELLDRQVSEARFRRITSIVNNTRIVFEKISLHSKRFGRSITRLKKKNSKWRYTTIEFRLDHQDLKLLLDEKFIVKIVDRDNGKVMSYIESNPNFPDSSIDSKGVNFKYDGNLVEISYYNNQPKIAKNYEVQVYFVSDEGEEYLLLNGTRPFVKDRKVIR